MELFDIIIVAFASMVLLSISLGSLAVCVKCLQARKRRRLGPSEDADGRDPENRDVLDKWPDMTIALKQQQLEEGKSRQLNGAVQQPSNAIQVQPIAGIIVVRPALPTPIQPILDISRTVDEPKRILAHQSTGSSESGGGGQLENQHPDMLEHQQPTSNLDSSRTSTSSTVETREEGRLEREKEFKSSILLGHGANDWPAVREEDEQEDEEEHEDGAETTRKTEPREDEQMQQSGEEAADEEDDASKRKSPVEEEKRETIAEQTERELLGETAEDLPEDKAAELEEKEAIQKAIGPPEPKID